MTEKNRFKWEVHPIANMKNIVKGNTYRFTILTPSLIRIEQDKDGIFEDRASQSIFNRDFDPVSYMVSKEGDLFTIETDNLVLQYVEDTKFSIDTLSIRLKCEPASIWNYSEEFEELGGTASTLDNINGPVRIGKGVCSRNGFSVLDDGKRMVLDDDGWVNVRRKDTVDMYFFGYGYNYLGAVKDYYKLTGAPVMLPAYALGNWWSRYHKYTQQEYIDLMERFKKEDVPISVAIVDMDWHLVDLPEDVPYGVHKRKGWTGYTWNRELFPDYRTFLKYFAENNLKTALNLHPSDGCRWHEDMYEKMCKVSGIDPASKKTVPLDLLNPDAMANYFDILLHPYEEDGVNFWWIDWQQGNDYGWIHEPNQDGNLYDEREVLNPLWQLNHLHVLDIQRNGKRPMYFSRYDGPGSHRYSIGFSGDTHVTWESLKFQPYFTATASNIGYCWWSHDIGGHMLGARDEELTTRWVQLGVFSPINRLHSSNNIFQGKEPWNYDVEYDKVMRRFLHMRAELFPYIYTMNYRTYKEGEPLIWPMYYTHPKCSSAYEAKNQFWFGSELMVAPITEPRDNVDRLGCVNVWFPKGVWFDFFDGTVYHSENGRNLDVFRKLEDYPVFAKAGAIIPQTVLKPHSNKLDASEELFVTVFPGASNIFNLYEDEGEYYNCEKGASVVTKLQLDYTGKKAVFKIASAKGDQTLIPEERKWNLQFRSFTKDAKIVVEVDGNTVKHEWKYDKTLHTIELTICAKVTSEITVILQAEKLIYNNEDRVKKCYEILYNAQIDYVLKDKLYEIIKGDYKHHHARIRMIHAVIPMYNHLAKALKEQITLDKDEFYHMDV